MASPFDPGSISSSKTKEKLARSHIKTESLGNSKHTGEVKESFMAASDLFCQKMGGMIDTKDVQSILEKQAETLKKFEKTNAKFGKFNDLSCARYLHLNQQLKNHTKMLLDMKKDLDSIFRRIRNLKMKLIKQFGPAFHAISAGIQKLEEELGASIENEYSESQELNFGSQSTDQGKQAKQQKAEGDIGQRVGHSVGNETVAKKETEFQLQNSAKGSADSASNFQVNQVLSGTKEMKNAVTRAGSTNKENGAVDTSNSETVDTDYTNQSVEMTGMNQTETVDDDQTHLTVDTGYSAQAVDMSGISQTETVHIDVDHTYLAVDTHYTVQTVDMSDMHQTQSSVDSPEAADTSRIHDITHKTKDTNIETVDTTKRRDSSGRR